MRCSTNRHGNVRLFTRRRCSPLPACDTMHACMYGRLLALPSLIICPAGTVEVDVRMNVRLGIITPPRCTVKAQLCSPCAMCAPYSTQVSSTCCTAPIDGAVVLSCCPCKSIDARRPCNSTAIPGYKARDTTRGRRCPAQHRCPCPSQSDQWQASLAYPRRSGSGGLCVVFWRTVLARSPTISRTV